MVQRRGGMGGQRWPGGRRSWFVHALALLLVPVLIIATPNVATAAAYGPAVSHSWTFDANGGIRPFGEASCGLVAFWESDAPAVHARVKCDLEWNAEVGGTMTLDFQGSDAASEFCEASTGSHVIEDGVTSTGSGTITTDGDAGTCRMSEVCWQYVMNDPTGPGGSLNVDGCFVLDLGAMGETAAECTIGGQPASAIKPGHGQVITPGTPIGLTYQEMIWGADGGSPGDWLRYLVVRRTGGTGVWYPILAVGAKTQHPNDDAMYLHGFDVGSDGHATGWPSITQHPRTSRSDDAGNPQESFSVLGAGMIHGPTLATKWGIPFSATVREGSVRLPQFAPPPGMVGITDPTACAFYWGAKVAEVPNSETDEPIGELGGGGTPDPPTGEPDPPAAPDGCGDFSITDPSTWAGGGICALVQLIGALLGLVGDLIGIVGEVLGAILGLVADLLAGLLDLLLDLFVPDPGSWGINDLRNQWENRPPGSVVSGLGDGFGGIADGFQGAGNCGVLADFSTDDITGEVTCSSLKDQPGMGALYGLVQAGLIGITCWGLWRIVVGQITNGGK